LHAEIRAKLAVCLPPKFSASGNVLTASFIGKNSDRFVALKAKYTLLFWRLSDRRIGKVRFMALYFLYTGSASESGDLATVFFSF
jgi:hypothetical protein